MGEPLGLQEVRMRGAANKAAIRRMKGASLQLPDSGA
jgi:hypothetical protein